MIAFACTSTLYLYKGAHRGYYSIGTLKHAILTSSSSVLLFWRVSTVRCSCSSADKNPNKIIAIKQCVFASIDGHKWCRMSSLVGI